MHHGTTLRPDTQAVGILLIDAATGKPVPLDYGFTVTRTTAPDGTLATVRLPWDRSRAPDTVRAHLIVDTYPAAHATPTASGMTARRARHSGDFIGACEIVPTRHNS